MEKRACWLRRSNSGSLSLEAIFSIGAGLLTASLFGNLAGYVGARGAVEQGAIAAMRCLTPTDAACQSVTTLSPEVSGSWWGRLPASTESRVYIPQVNYSLSYTSRKTEFSFTPYLLELVEPEVAWREVTVPVVRSRAEQNIGENRFGTLQVAGARYWYQLANAFPPFTQDENSDPDSWVASNGGGATWQRTYGLIDPSRGEVESNKVYSHGPLSISGGQTQQFVSNWISVPQINATLPCLDNNAANCSAAMAAGDGVGANWQQFVYVAVKASAKVYATAGSPQVSWKQTNPGSSQTSDAGLYVVIQDAAGAQTWRKLGGRDWENVRRGEQNATWYNMWLRGPAGANGGSATNPLVGNNDYDAIAVPRGGKFQFVGSLAAQGGTVQAEVVYLYHLADVQERSEPAQVTCDNLRYSFKTKTPLCPSSLSACSAPAGFIAANNKWCSAGNFAAKATVPVCSESGMDQHAKRFSGATTIYSAEELSCSGKAQTTLSASAGRSLCGEVQMENVGSAVQVVAAGASCPAATKDTKRKASCNELFVKGTSYTPSQCNLKSDPNFIAATQQEVAWFSGAIKGEKKLLRAVASYNGKAAPAKKLATVKVAVEEPAVVKSDGVLTWPKVKTPCDLRDELQQATLKLSPTAEFQASCDELARTVSVQQGEGRKVAASGYPFEGTVDELYYGQVGSFDFDPGGACSFQTSCPRYEGEKSLDEMLLAFARKSDPVLSQLSSDKQPQFEVSKSDTGKIRLVTSLEYQELSKICAPMSCVETARIQDQWQVVSESAAYPESCANGSYQECRFEADSIVEGPAATVDLANEALLRQIAMQEIGRIRLDARQATPCNGEAAPGCIDLSLDIDSSTSVAEIKVNYQLPVGFPLSLMLGADSIPLESTVREPVELLMFSER